MRREEIKMNEDEIGLAKASPFSFLPEASLLCKPPLSTDAKPSAEPYVI